jgi:transposase
MCKENIIVKALAEDCEPDHDTIATFISSNNEAVGNLFTQIVFQCSQLGLIKGEMFAIDGCTTIECIERMVRLDRRFKKEAG